MSALHNDKHVALDAALALINAPRYFKAQRSGTDQTSAATTAFKVAFNGDVEDPYGIFDTTNNRVTPGAAGIWQFNANVAFYTPAAVGIATLMLYKNGSPVVYGGRVSQTVASALQGGVGLSAVESCDADDYFEVFFVGSHAGTKGIYGTTSLITTFSGVKIG